MTEKIQVYLDPKKYWDEIFSQISSWKQNTQNFRIAASGGSAANIFDELITQKFNFTNTEIFQTDERYVPKTHPDANTFLLNNKLDQVNINTHFFDTELPWEESAIEYQKHLTQDPEGFLFDCTILGVGPDGHTASLFPHIPELDDQKNLTAHTTTENFAIKKRLTLTFNALQKSRHILVLMMGKNKANILEKITNPENNFHDYPAIKILEWPQAEIYFLDN